MIAWALVVCSSTKPLSGYVVAHDFKPAEKGETVWEYEIDALGFGSLIDSLGEPPAPGIWVFECADATYEQGDGWETDSETVIEGQYRALRQCELEAITECPDLEAFCAMDENGTEIVWKRPENGDSAAQISELLEAAICKVTQHQVIAFEDAIRLGLLKPANDGRRVIPGVWALNAATSTTKETP